MRILCLHGMGTSSQIFTMQTAGLRSELGEPHIHTFDFVEGGVDCPAAPGISALFPSAEYFTYYDPTNATSILQAVDDLSTFVSSEGPFHGVMGFSQGAALAAMLLARNPSSVPFSFAIFLCAGLPFCERSLRQGMLRHLDPRVDGELIRVPTAHIVGAKDDALESSLKLKDLCDARVRGYFDHGAGHEVPVSPKGITGDMARCVENAIARATFVQ